MRYDKILFIGVEIFVVFFVVIWLTYALGVNVVHLAGWANWARLGQFGDSFGALTALFSGITVAGLVYTIVLQQHQIGLQQKEILAAEQRHTMEGMNIARQRFETTFFNLLALHHNIVSLLTVKPFNLLLLKIKNSLPVFPNGSVFDGSLFQKYQECYKSCIADYEPDLSSYEQSIASIYTEIENSILSDEEKKIFFKRFWSYLSQPERQALYYILVLTEQPSDTLLELLNMEKKYRFLRNMPDKSFINSTHKQIAAHVPTFNGQQ